jgi:hypothetical protein
MTRLRLVLVLVLVLVLDLGLGGCGGGGEDSSCADTLIAGDLVITEVFADADAPTGSSGADEGHEWFEVYNAGTRTLDLTGVEVVHSRGDGTMAHRHTLTPVSIAAGDYLVLGNVLPDLKPSHVDYGYADALGDLYNTGTGRITLSCGDSMIDGADYADVAPGVSRQLDGGALPDYTANDNLANWCAPDSALEFEPANFGTPGAANLDCEVITPGTCNDGGTPRATVPPAPGDLVITEIMPSPDASEDALGEWFEVRAMTDVDLNGVTLDRIGDSSEGDLIESEDCIHLAAGDFAVLAKSTDPTMNGGLPAVAATFDFSMVTGSASTPGDVAVLVDTQVIDAFAWTGSSTGASLQVDPDFADATANDDETKWCDGTTPYGAGDLGTPGAVNGECVILPPPGMCDDGTALRAIVNPGVGDVVITEVMPSPAAVGDADGEWFEVLAVADFDLNDLGLDRAGDAAAPDFVTSIACLPVTAGTRLLFARNTDAGMNGGLPPVDAVFGFSLVTGSVATPGDVQVVIGATPTVLDAVTWTGSTSGASIQLDPDFTDPVSNDDEASFCDGTTAYGAGDLGTPAAANLECGGGGTTCLDGGTPRPIVNPVIGDLVITEVMPSPAAVSDATGEWFEVLVTASVDLNGVGLDRAGDAAAPNVITSPDCVEVTNGMVLVFARNADPAMNGMLPPVTATFAFTMVGTTGDVRLIAADTTTVLDAITWATAPDGASLALDPDASDVVSNDVESNYCPGTTPYGLGDLGTPGGANAQCPVVVPPGMCVDGGSGSLRPIDEPVAGEVAITEWMPDPMLVSDANGEWIEALAGAGFDLNGVQLGAATLGPPVVASTTCVPVTAGTRLLFARNASSGTNGGLPPVDATFGFGLTNGSGTLQIGVGDVALDTRTYAASAAGTSIQLDTDGTQCNAPPGTAAYNGADVGTPAAAHTAECP